MGNAWELSTFLFVVIKRSGREILKNVGICAAWIYTFLKKASNLSTV